jgi:ribosomal protein S18 acetylase RimI-like enzyme
MTIDYEIVYDPHPERSAWGIIGRGLSAFNQQQAGDEGAQRICYVIQAPNHEIVGGVVAAIYWDWLYIDLMWMKEELRGRGYGSRLLVLAEEEARKRGAKHAFLDTFSFQAPGFYEKHGYRVYGELQNFPQSHRRYFMSKLL